MFEKIDLTNYTYDLPDERIARFPVEPRDSSKLLVYRPKENQLNKIEQYIFSQLPELLPSNTFLVFNNTKVIPARLFFQKPTKNGLSGAIIEIFLLNPMAPSNIISQIMETTKTCTWACMIGNKKRWREEKLKAEFKIQGETIEFLAELIDSEQNLVKFNWNTFHSFAEIVKTFGEIPLPPYLKRKTQLSDLENYQTVYSKNDGAVAAPTAGLHFTEDIFKALARKKIKHDFLTLHVGAGTFQPIKVTNLLEHRMHSEQVVFNKSLIINLLQNVGHIIPVGTTSMRSLESLYWFGVKLLENPVQKVEFFIEKLFPYQTREKISTVKSLTAVLDFMEKNNLVQLIGETEIFIFPGYEFTICQGIITNFHQPNSTLILLVAALVGGNWRKIYDFALQNDFRFLSYGDSSLLLKG